MSLETGLGLNTSWTGNIENQGNEGPEMTSEGLIFSQLALQDGGEMNGHQNSLEMIEVTGQQAGKSQNGQVPSKSRNTNPDVSYSAKHHCKGIIDQFNNALKTLPGYSKKPEFKRLMETLKEGMLRKTSFLFLCILIGMVDPFKQLGSVLDKILRRKMDKIANKQPAKEIFKENSLISMQMFFQIRSKTSKIHSYCSRLLVQDIMKQLFQTTEFSGFDRTKNGLKAIQKKRLAQTSLLLQRLSQFGDLVREDVLVSKPLSTEFIQPNYQNIPLELVRPEDVQQFHEHIYVNQDQEDDYYS